MTVVNSNVGVATTTCYNTTTIPTAVMKEKQAVTAVSATTTACLHANLPTILLADRGRKITPINKSLITFHHTQPSSSRKHARGIC